MDEVLLEGDRRPLPEEPEASMVSPLCPECDGTSVALDTVLVIPPYPPDDSADTVEASRVACALPTNGSIASMASSCRSDANSSTVGPTCRICDYSGEAANQLINPCRCSGTSKFVHEQCLNKWLETINSQSSPHCEVCRYHIRTHKKYRMRNWSYPEVSRRDKCLHLVFLVSLLVLVICAVTNIIGIVADSRSIPPAPQREVSMTSIEGMTLISGLLFFVAFVVALVTQIKAKDNVYHLVLQFFAINTKWKIDNYKKSSDSLYAN